MKLAVSNIAWAPTRRDEAYDILMGAGIPGLEIAPGLFFDGAADAFVPTPAEADAALDAMRAAGLSLVSMQSLLFGVEGAALFEGEAALDRFRTGMRRAIALAGRFGIRNLVFGSPRQRNVPDGMSFAAAEALAADEFRTLGDAAVAAGVVVAIEPNPAAYGTNFLNTVTQAEAFMRMVDHPGITLNLDIGSMHMNGDFDQLEGVVARSVDRISHVHLSEPRLGPAPADAGQAEHVLKTLLAAGYRHWFSIEMTATPDAGLAPLEASVARLLTAASGARTLAAS